MTECFLQLWSNKKHNNKYQGQEMLYRLAVDLLATSVFEQFQKTFKDHISHNYSKCDISKHETMVTQPR